MKREATAVWQGGLKDGEGRLSVRSGVFHGAPFSYHTRFGEQPGTNPEELIAAAHAGCFSMALSYELQKSKITPGRFETTAVVHLDLVGGRWTIHEVELRLKGSIGRAPRYAYLAAVSRAKENCPVSRLLNATVTLHTQLHDLSGTPLSGAPPEVVVYTSTYCKVCGLAKELLDKQGISYCEIDLDQEDPEFTEELKRKTGLMKVPQVFVGGHYIGSYDDLVRLDLEHGLVSLLRPGNRRSQAA